MERRRREADEFHASFVAGGVTDEEAMIMRQGFSALLWSQQFYRFDVDRWLRRRSRPATPAAERAQGRNAAWRHVDANDVILMPDTWEYPWFASWDLAFHCVTMAHLDPVEAKRQLLLLLREWYTHPNGQLPAYEWEFGDANPPVHAWAALRVFQIEGSTDLDFLARVFHKLLINFTWWVNRKDAEGNNLFEGGFLGLDNIGPLNRSEPLPVAGVLEQSDGSGWMAMYCLNLLDMALILGEHDPAYEDIAVKFAEHFASIASAMTATGHVGRRRSAVRRHHPEAGRLDRPRPGAVDGRRDPDDGAVGGARPPGGPTAGLHQPSRVVLPPQARGADVGHLLDHDTRARCCCRWCHPSGSARCSRACSTRTASCRRTACARCRAGTSTIPRSSTSTGCGWTSTTSRPSRARAVRRQLQLARSGVVPVNYLVIEALVRTGRSSGTRTRWSTRPGRATRCPSTRSPTAWPAG